MIPLTEKFYVTTPIYYVNASPHIGTAYSTFAADAIARYQRLKGKEVFFLTGTDEHGQKIQQAAEAQGKEPKQFCDEIAEQFKVYWKELGISYDRFIRTTDPYHEKAAKKFFQTLKDSGDIYPGEYEGWYCTPCETFWPESKLSSGAKCPECGRPVEKMKEETYFFKLTKYLPAVEKHIRENQEFVQPYFRANELLNIIRDGLDDLSVTRTKLQWGIPCPFDEKHVIYVWFEALINYLSAAGYGSEEKKEKEHFEKFWPADIHVVGKDILKFHAIIWPAMLLSADIKLPKTVFAHGWLTVREEKISKSKGNAVNPLELKKTYGLDAIKYFVLREVPFGQDGDYSEEALKTRYSTELANDLGNLVNRTAVMIEKYSKGKIPKHGKYRPKDEEHIALVKEKAKLVDEYYGNYEFHKALTEAWQVVASTNRFINENEPWDLAERYQKRCETVLYILAETIRIISVLIAPVLADSSSAIRKTLSLEEAKNFDSALEFGLLQSGTKVQKQAVLFKKLK